MRYVMIFLAVLVVLLLMIAFMFLVIRQVSDRVTGQVNGRYMRELSVFDRLYEEKKKKLEELEAFETYQPDIVIYDVLGDVVCGGFAMPIRGGYAKDVYVVSSGEMMSLYAANNIASAIRNFGKRGYAQLRGLILNAKNIENEREIVAKAVEEIGTQVVCYVPRSPEIQEAENQGGTVFEFLTNSVMQGVYNELADRILADA